MANPLKFDSSHLPQQDPLVDVLNPEHYKVGTLTYTKLGLVKLFALLLWGDFCWSVMEGVIPSVMPQKMHDIHASNEMLGLITGTIPSAMTTVLNPIVSFRSDRFRSRWGRRIPFLAGVTPFLVVFLILLGFEEPISRWGHQVVLSGKYSYDTVAILVIGVLMVAFQFFNLFTQSVFYYLFNDVVPHAFLARFFALFRIAGGAAGISYSYFLFPIADKYMAPIFFGAAMLYFVGYGMMCWKVKEGQYPPPQPYIGNEHGLVASVKTYFVECYSHRLYWFLFLANSCQSLTWVSGGFGLLLCLNYMGFDRTFLGHLSTATGIIGMILTYPGGIIADRFHPLRVILFVACVGIPLTPIWYALYFPWHSHLTHIATEHLWIALALIGLPLSTVSGACELPLLMKLFPQGKFGQFCSANALIRGIAMAIGGVGCGAYLDYMKRFNPNPDYCYRYLFVWNMYAGFGYFFFLVLVYRGWKRLGGMAGYHPPGSTAPDAPAESETTYSHDMGAGREPIKTSLTDF